MRYSDADRPSREGKPYHFEIASGTLPKYILLPGSPERAKLIADSWERKKTVAAKREFLTFAGRYERVDIACASIGIGSPAASIAVEELASAGVDTFIRVGSTGSIQKDIRIGDLIINVACVRYDGTTNNYMPPEYPAYANHEVTLALIEAAESLDYKYHIGASCSTSSFYAGQSRTGFKGYAQPWIGERIEIMRRARVLNFEEESSTVFVLSSLYGLRAGAISFVIADRFRNLFDYKGEQETINVANKAVKILAGWDKAKSKARKQSIFPTLISNLEKAP
jgi:uridine phosphorylase